MNIRKELHPIEVGDKFELHVACYSMSLQDKNTMLKILKEVKVMDGYSSNISRCIDLKQRKISQLKSHNCHVLMQELLSAALLHTFSKEVRSYIFKLCTFFKTLCLKYCQVADFEMMKYNFVETLCQLEMIFLPSFFDIMVHVTIHLA